MLLRCLMPNMEDQFSTRGVDEIRKMGLLRVATQDAIHKLSSRTKVKIDVDLGNGIRISKVLERNEFEEVNRDVFEKCEELVKRCLKDAKVETGDINDVILVGGCSNIPRVRNILTSICKTEINVGIHPLEAAVRGAALKGAKLSGTNDPFVSFELLGIQATTSNIGINVDGNTFFPVIRQNTTMPVRQEIICTTVHDNQNEALILVYEGDEKRIP